MYSFTKLRYSLGGLTNRDYEKFFDWKSNDSLRLFNYVYILFKLVSKFLLIIYPVSSFFFSFMWNGILWGLTRYSTSEGWGTGRYIDTVLGKLNACG